MFFPQKLARKNVIDFYLVNLWFYILDFEAMAPEEQFDNKGCSGVYGGMAAGTMFRSWSLEPSTPKVEPHTDASALSCAA